MDNLEDVPIASTIIDLFDKLGTLRQGTWNCKLYKNIEPDYNESTMTAALPPTDEQCIELNNMLRMI
jgi:hypothetical protein